MKLIFLISLFLFPLSVFAENSALAIKVEPKDVEIYIDGELKANSSPSILRLPAGTYQLSVRKDGYQTQQLEVVLAEAATVSKHVTLVKLGEDIQADSVSFDKLLHPVKDSFETEDEFIERRAGLLDKFNKASLGREPLYQAGIAKLNKAGYDVETGFFPVTIKWQPWTKFLGVVQDGYVELKRDEAAKLWESGQEKPVFITVKYVNDHPIIDEQVLLEGESSWVIKENPMTIDDLYISPIVAEVSLDNFFRDVDKGDVQYVEYYIKNGIDVNAKDSEKDTALARAIIFNQLKVAKLLIENNANVNAMESGTTPLHWAAIYGRLEAAQILLKNDANPHILDSDNWNALHYASRGLYFELVNLLKNAGVDASIKTVKGDTADDWLETQDWLKGGFFSGPKVQYYNVFSSIRWRPIETILYFELNDDMNINIADEYGWGILHYIVIYDKTEFFVNRLWSQFKEKNLTDQINLNKADNEGKTPLHYSSEHGNADMIENLLYLMETKARQKEALLLKDKQEFIPLAYAIMYGHIQTVKKLVQAMKAADAEIDFMYSLYYAATTSRKDIVEFLLQEGADLNEVDEGTGHTTFDYIKAEYFKNLAQIEARQNTE